jgi:hypothetical protein
MQSDPGMFSSFPAEPSLSKLLTTDELAGHTRTHTQTCMFTQAYTHTDTHTHRQTQTHTQTNTHTDTHDTHTHTHTHTNTHTHTHTHTHRRVRQSVHAFGLHVDAGLVPHHTDELGGRGRLADGNRRAGSDGHGVFALTHTHEEE